MREQLTVELRLLVQRRGVRAIATETGISQGTLYRILRGERNIGGGTLDKLLTTYPALRTTIVPELVNIRRILNYDPQEQVA